MPRNVFGHLKHGHLLFASKNSFERIVGIDQCLLLRVLKLVFFDVIPQLLVTSARGSGFDPTILASVSSG
jgi:hypothetical protein